MHRVYSLASGGEAYHMTSVPRFQRHDKSHYLILDFALNFHQFNMHVTWTQNRKSEAF